MATRMLQRRGTAAEWAAENPILASGEIGFETDTKLMKLGDGVTPWNSLVMPYMMSGGATMTGALSLIAPTQPEHAARMADVHAELLAEVDLTSSLATITLASIPQTFRDLRLVISGKSSDATDRIPIHCQLNGVTTAVYNTHRVQAAGTNIVAAAGVSETTITLGHVPGAFSKTRFGVTDVLFPNYASVIQSSFFATTGVIPNSDAADTFTAMTSGRMNSSLAITSITMFPSVGSWYEGTSMSLYGLGRK